MNWTFCVEWGITSHYARNRLTKSMPASFPKSVQWIVGARGTHPSEGNGGESKILEGYILAKA